MARFKVATVDGYEIIIEHDAETPADLATAMKDRKTIDATEIIRSSEEPGRVVIFTDHIVAIRDA